jgi:hypothetical protein
MKLVKESISFVRGDNPKSILGIGEYHLIKKWLDEMYIFNYHINDDMSIDVKGHVEIKKIIEELPEYIQFNHVTGDFLLFENPKIKSLRGCPKKVDIDCLITRDEKLKKFIGAPVYIGRNFYCRKLPNIKSLEGFPEYIGGNLYLGTTTLKYVYDAEIRKNCKIYGIIKRHDP